MTDREVGYIVTLEKSIREDDAENIKNAIRMIKGIISVEPVIDTPVIHIAKETVRHELINKLFNILNEK